MKRALVLLAGLLALLAPTAPHAEPMTVEVIPLGYRSAEEVIPVLEPLLAPGGSISGLRNQLVVRTTASNLETLRQVLATLDAAPRRLLVTVRQDTGSAAHDSAASVTGSTDIGSNARIVLPPGPGARDRRGARVTHDGLTGRVVASQDVRRDDQEQRLQVLEGSEAFIQVGQSIPYPERSAVQTPYGTTVVETTRYRDLATGFYVRPRVSGDIVTLDVSPQREVPGPRGSVDTQRVVTTVSGRLGEWIEIGGAHTEAATAGSGLLSRSGSARSEDRRILLKVEPLR